LARARAGAALESSTQTSADADVFARAWAHVSLRTVDWAIRHDVAMVRHWVEVSRRHL
jgi:hypothetical protein